MNLSISSANNNAVKDAVGPDQMGAAASEAHESRAGSKLTP